MPYPCAATRTLSHKPSLTELQEQATELLESYKAGELAAVAEVARFQRNSLDRTFALADAQRVLAHAYGFCSWPALENHVAGADFAARISAAESGDASAVQRLAAARADPLNEYLSEVCNSGLKRAVQHRNEELTGVLIQLGANARAGVWPHREASSAYAIAVDREYSEIVATIEREEENRRARRSQDGTPSTTAVEALRHAIADGRTADAIAFMEADPLLIGAPDLYGVTPLHLAAWKHDPALVGWLLDHGASPAARALRDTPVRNYGMAAQPVESGKTPLDFAAIVAGRAPEGRDGIFYFMENARIDPARFHETARLLLEKGAELTSRAAVALGDREAVLRLHRAGRLSNEIHIVRGGLLSIAVRVNRIDMVATLLDLGLDPDEAIPTGEGYPGWGMPLWTASMCGRHEIAELLLARGADVNAIVCACGDSICSAGDETMTALLRKHGARVTVETVTDPKIAHAILDGTVKAYSLNSDEDPALKDLAEIMLGSYGLEIDRLCLTHITRKRDDPWWNGALLKAAMPESLKLILDHDVDPGMADAAGYTVLHNLASDLCQASNEEARVLRATMLLDAGASLNKRDPLLHSTPLGWACRWGRIELVRLYLERGADALETDAEPWATPVAWAKKRGHQEIVQLLHSALDQSYHASIGCRRCEPAAR